MATPPILVSSLVADTRVISGVRNNQVWTDDNIAMALSDAGSELYDEFTETNNHYNISTFLFTLAGGIGHNSTPQPTDFQQGHSLELNPNTANPITVPYLSNWLNRNDAGWGSMLFFNGAGGPSREYCFSDDLIVIFPPQNSAGNYQLYYTPKWTTLALFTSISPQTASIPVVPTTTMGFGVGNQFILDTGPDTFQATDVGNFITVTGATTPSNDGSWTIATYTNPTRVVVGASVISETFPGGATVTLSRQSFVTAVGVWTFFGASEFTETTGNVHVGDTITVSGATNAGNNGTFEVTAVGLNTVTTADAVGLVAENFVTGTVSVAVQPAGTRPDLPPLMNSWALYLKVHAAITIRTDRDQNVDALQVKLAGLKQRITSVLANRQEEPTQPPLTRGSGGIFGLGDW